MQTISKSLLSQSMSRRDALKRLSGAALLTAVSSSVLSACGGVFADEGDVSEDGTVATGDINLTGSGASFPDPIYQVWIDAYRSIQPDVSINYQSVGSGQGKRDFINNVTDFGASDAPLTDEEMEQVPNALHIPTVIGAVGVTYNVPGISHLQLSGQTLADIYLGNITRWDHPVIVAENPDVEMPDIDIGVIFRSDGSGTTAIFTDFLSKVSEEWADRVGSATSVQWPVGIGGEKNPGVMAGVQQVPGAIGYVELIYAEVTGMPVVWVQNQLGTFVEPSLESVQEAAAGYLDDLPDDLRVSITNPPSGENAYPISGFTWLLLRQERENLRKTEALLDFIYWALTEGDDYANDLHYSPLPDVVEEMAIDMIESVTVDGETVLDPSETSLTRRFRG